MYCALHYRYSPLVREQLSKRFPLFYSLSVANSIPISGLLIFKDFCILFCCLTILRQLYYYRSTKHIYQGISITSTIILSIFLMLSIFTYACSISNLPLKDSGKFGIFYLEHINYLWVMANLVKSFKYIPQMSINWMGCSTMAVSYTHLDVYKRQHLQLFNRQMKTIVSLPFFFWATYNLVLPLQFRYFNYPCKFAPVMNVLGAWLLVTYCSGSLCTGMCCLLYTSRCV